MDKSRPERPVIKHCVLCGVAMIASKSREHLEREDTFSCLNCGTVVTSAPTTPNSRKS